MQARRHPLLACMHASTQAGTTSLAEHLRAHPALSGPVGLPYHEALAKETHFFEGEALLVFEGVSL